MNLSGEYKLPLPRQAVWEGLNDPDVLKRCIPGCEELIKSSDTEMSAKVALKIGPMSAKFSGKVTLSEIDPPKGYKIAGEGQGGVAGFGKGSAVVSLEEDGPAGTILRYTADSQVGGKIAQLGSRLIDATAKKLADEFFGKFAAAMAERAGPQAATPGSDGAADGSAAVQTSAPTPVSAPPAAGGGLSPAVWIPALVVALAAVYWLASR
ncbi:MAG: carbon monoxide dehydrogenase subunit G [Alphaproteobacteria bacterium]|nr:carbon monoxide dehydrogenase subunit G [Alphaproteobacteria bacterium]